MEGFAEAHVVGQAGAEEFVVVADEPAGAGELVGAQGGLQFGAGLPVAGDLFGVVGVAHRQAEGGEERGLGTGHFDASALDLGELEGGAVAGEPLLGDEEDFAVGQREAALVALEVAHDLGEGDAVGADDNGAEQVEPVVALANVEGELAGVGAEALAVVFRWGNFYAGGRQFGLVFEQPAEGVVAAGLRGEEAVLAADGLEAAVQEGLEEGPLGGKIAHEAGEEEGRLNVVVHAGGGRVPVGEGLAAVDELGVEVVFFLEGVGAGGQAQGGRGVDFGVVEAGSLDAVFLRQADDELPPVFDHAFRRHLHAVAAQKGLDLVAVKLPQLGELFVDRQPARGGVVGQHLDVMKAQWGGLALAVDEPELVVDAVLVDDEFQLGAEGVRRKVDPVVLRHLARRHVDGHRPVVAAAKLQELGRAVVDVADHGVAVLILRTEQTDQRRCLFGPLAVGLADVLVLERLAEVEGALDVGGNGDGVEAEALELGRLVDVVQAAGGAAAGDEGLGEVDAVAEVEVEEEGGGLGHGGEDTLGEEFP